jgi:serine/threonine-protein kinase
MQTLAATDSSLIPAYLPDQLPEGAKAGPWTVEREIGRGGMGSVYAVVHDDIGKRAALKVIHRRLLQPTHIERMLLEARVVNRVGHPNIVDIFETGTLPDGRPYIVMERLDGCSLAARVAEGHIMPVDVISILLQVCEALIAAHACGVIHRDLKTDNVFLCDGEQPPRVKLLDWGIAKELANDVRHTSEGHVVGTPQYLAPEQARAGKVSDRTDVYSLGVMAYELLLEQLPFEAETPLEVMTMHLRAVPPAPHELWPGIPPALDKLLLAMLAKDPAQRPSAIDVAKQLEAVRDELEARRGVASTPIQRRSSAKMIRAATPVGLAPTESAGSGSVSGQAWQAQPAGRRWQYAIGAAAVALSALLFFISRESDSQAAENVTTPVAHLQGEAPAPTPLPVPVAAKVVPALAPRAPAPPVRREPMPQPKAVVQHAAAPAPMPMPLEYQEPRRGSHHKAVATPPPAAKPAHLDPNGTMDPYAQ